MKHYEELSRLHIDEAIQTGLKSQSVHRALSEKKRQTPPASLETVEQLNPYPSGRFNWFIMLFIIIGKFIGG